MIDADDTLAFGCPVPATRNDTVQLAHGGGGRAMARLIDEIIRPTLDDAELDRRHDGAVLNVAGPIAFTTDSYVVQPLVFPGGDIGSLAVNGTVNDLAMCGARPSWLSVGLILEAGHQGRRSRQGGWHVRQHGRNRPGRRAPSDRPA